MNSNEKKYHGLIEVTRTYKISFESTSDDQTLTDLEVIMPTNDFGNHWEKQKRKVLEIRKDNIPGPIVYDHTDKYEVWDES